LISNSACENVLSPYLCVEIQTLMERIAKEIFSMRMMVVALFIFLISIGLATFVETVYDTQTAKIMVYNAGWFMWLLTYLSVGMIANIFTHRMYRPEKIAMFSFHLAFLVIMIGAGVTRFWGFEGLMIIGEGETVGKMYSSDPYLTVKVSEDGEGIKFDRLSFMSEAVNNHFTEEFDFDLKNHKPHKGITVEYMDFRKNLLDSLVQNDSIKEMALGIATNGTEPDFLGEGRFIMMEDVAISFEKDDAMPGVLIWKEGNDLKMKGAMPMRSIAMSQLRQSDRETGVADSMYTTIPTDSVVTLQMATLYNYQGRQFVLKEIKRHAKFMLVKAKVKDTGYDFLTLRLRDGKKDTVVNIGGGLGNLQRFERFVMNGLTYEIGYGCKEIKMPFQVLCRDFQLDRYPGSNNPSSFASELTIIDKANNKRFDKRLFMNNVIDYEGYRLFQSGYEPDESGTRLSVNHDAWGTNISYVGYLLMTIGMIMSFIAPGGRMREMFTQIRENAKKRSSMNGFLLALALTGATSVFAEQTVPEDHTGHDHATEVDHTGHDHGPNDDHANHDQAAPPVVDSKPPPKGDLYIMTKEHSELAATLLVLDKDGRCVPLHTMSDKILRKIHRGNTYNGYNAVQLLVSMHMYPNYWAKEKIIYISSKGGLRELLGVDEYATFHDIYDWKTKTFKLESLYNKAHQTLESKRNEQQKQVIKLGEKFEIMLNIFNSDWTYMKMLPIAGEKAEDWKSILHHDVKSKEFTTAIAYLGALNEACMGGDYTLANENLEKLKNLQRTVGGSKMPSERIVKIEVLYNKMDAVKNAAYAYFFLGFFLLLIFLFQTLARERKRRKFLVITEKVLFWSTIAVFVFHGVALLFRALISGHEPWSNGYEALVFIAWITVLLGILFARINKVILAGACLMAFFLLFVCTMNILDPEITNLQPVLKSYWLMIHVAIITASYAPLGIASIIGLINLILYTARSKDSHKDVSLMIKELTYIAEITITIGVVMLTIGTFLGGVWANESWGRYWGWDPKETWALVAVLAYAVILHLRFIPALKDKFTFSTVAFWGYSTILFTFFGVNFYLVGLHSYANGEGLAEFPGWLTWMIGFFYLFTEIASFRNQQYILKGAPIPLKHFIKKVSILSTMILVIALMMYLFAITDFATIFGNAAKVIGVILVTNGLFFVLGQGRLGSVKKEPLNL